MSHNELISEKRVSSLIFDSKNNLPKNRFSYDGTAYQISLIFFILIFSQFLILSTDILINHSACHLYNRLKTSVELA
jgi:hypothetical protein